MKKPFRIKFNNIIGSADDSTCLTNAEYSMSLGFPLVEQEELHERKLAVVGGSPDLLQDIEELRHFDGDIWAVNRTCKFLAGHGIKSTLITCDCIPYDAELISSLDGVQDAIVAAECDKSLFDNLKTKNIKLFRVLYGDNYIGGGTTTACRAMQLALRLGYHDIRFYGCSSSFEETSHAYKTNQIQEDIIVIKANGKEFVTNVAMFLQAETLVEVMKEYPETFVNKSRGLLAAMLADYDGWEVTGFSEDFAKTLIYED